MRRIIAAIRKFFRPLWPEPYVIPDAMKGMSPEQARNFARKYSGCCELSADAIRAGEVQWGISDSRHPRNWRDDFGWRVLGPEIVDGPTPEHAKSIEQSLRVAAEKLVTAGTLERRPASFIANAAPHIINELLRSGLWLMRAPETPETKESDE